MRNKSGSYRIFLFLLVLAVAAFPSASASADHSWGNYHWARTSNPFTIRVIDSMTSGTNGSAANWDDNLNVAISDWNASSVMNVVKEAGSDFSTTRKRCPAVAGKVRACNASYGNNGWLGLGDFAQSSTCGTSLAQTASCTISATFTPLITGLRTGDVKVFDDASGSPHAIILDGDGVAPPVPTVTAPSTVSFPTTQVGGSSSAIDITIGNSGGAPLVITAAELVGTGFAKVTDGCTGASITPSSSCVVSIVFAPTTSGAITATLRILSNAPTSPNFVGLTGQATVAPIASLSASPASLVFAEQVVDTTSPAQTVTLTNTGGATASDSDTSSRGTQRASP